MVIYKLCLDAQTGHLSRAQSPSGQTGKQLVPSFEPRREKTGLRGFRPRPTQTDV